MEMDSQLVYQALVSPTTASSPYKIVVADCQSLVHNMVIVMFSLVVKRCVNFVAQMVARVVASLSDLHG